MFRPLRIEYLGAYYQVYRKLGRLIEKIKEMASSTSMQKKTCPLFMTVRAGLVEDPINYRWSSYYPHPAPLRLG